MSQNTKILNYLKKGNSITGLEALKMFDCFRLPARIKDLKDSGIVIKSNTIQVNGKYVSEYWIPRTEVIKLNCK